MNDLIAANGMETCAAWEQHSPAFKVAYLARLTPLAIKAQASVLAVGNERNLESVLRGWIVLGWLTPAQATAARAARAEEARHAPA